MCKATSVGRSCGRIGLESKGMVCGERTDANDVELEKRDDLLLYVEEG